MLTAIRALPPNANAPVVATLALTASDRTRSRHRFEPDHGPAIYLNLPRGTILRSNDLLLIDDGQQVRVLAKPEPVIQVTAAMPFDLMRAAYHLGNRHVPLEISPNSLTLEPDPVLEAMLAQLEGLTLTPAIRPFEPEAGAYRQGGSPAIPSPSHHYAHVHNPTDRHD
ncbi:MAG: urease accessory protein UreE [Nodosilinea sp.]